MIGSATARRAVGDWAGACAEARVDVDVDLRAAARTHGRELATQVRADLRQLAPDLLRWHMPRIAPDGLLRPGLTMSLASYKAAGPTDGSAVHLVARTPPTWADAGQRISLALWDGSRSGNGSGPHPHPHPNQRYRLDLHRHLWDARRAGDLWERAGAGTLNADGALTEQLIRTELVPRELAAPWTGGRAKRRDWCAHRDLDAGTVAIRIGARRRLLLRVDERDDASGPPMLRITDAPAKGGTSAWPDLPDAAHLGVT